MNITLDELIEKLTDLRDDIDAHGDGEIDGGSVPVTFAIQPNYPIAVTFGEATAIIDGEHGPRVWIATLESPNDINPYAPRQAWEGDVVTATCTECDGEGCDECEDVA